MFAPAAPPPAMELQPGHVPPAAAAPRSEHERLRTLVGAMVLSAVPLLALSVYVGHVSGSLSVVAVLLHGGISLLLNVATFHVLRVVTRSNALQFPYGTGKLESFTGFFLGCGLVLVAGTIFERGVVRLAGQPAPVSLGLAQLVFLGNVVRLAGVVFWLNTMIRRSPSPTPLLHAYHVNCTSSLWHACGLLAAMLTGWLLSLRLGAFVSLAADLAVAGFFSAYLLQAGVRVIRANFRCLIDLPLREAEQLAILEVLARHYEDYADLGPISTRQSGAERRVEIELAFAPQATAAEIEALGQDLRRELSARLGGPLEFQLIARCRGGGARA